MCASNESKGAHVRFALKTCADDDDDGDDDNDVAKRPRCGATRYVVDDDGDTDAEQKKGLKG